MRSVITVAVAVAATVSIAAAAETPKIGAALYGLEHDYMQRWAAAIEDHPAVKAGNVDLTIFDGRYDENVQTRQFRQMIAEGYDAILFVPYEETPGAELVAEAHAAGIPVVGSNTRANSDLLTAYIGSDDVEGGYLEAKSVLDKLGCAGNVVILEGPIGQSAQIERLEGNRKALAECPDAVVLAQAPANWSIAESQSVLSGWLSDHGSDIQGVIGQNDEMALGAIAAIEAAGLDVEAFAIAGIDGTTEGLEAVKRGEMSSLLQDARAQSQGALDLALHALNPVYEPLSDIWTAYPEMPWNGGNDTTYTVPWTPVTEDNVEALLAERM
ncbi:substrate-binding domain-containing protein [Bauldia sp.]|uniref:substrate-binding domain-containing protein n=1 Tax=Bauldia sp. TaxID=2575872 RepID=UPI003BABA148